MALKKAGDLDVHATIPKSKTVQMLVSTVTHRGEVYVDIRDYVTSAQFSGLTRKGVRFRGDVVEDVIDGLRAAARAVAEKEEALARVEYIEDDAPAEDG